MIRWTMRQSGWMVLVAVLALGAGASAAPAGTAAIVPAPRPTRAIEPGSCVTAECHSEVKAYPVLHGPVNVNTCDACHRLTSAKAHTFELARQKAELCTFCHEFDTGMLPVVHAPVLAGECLGCHNPHGGRDNQMVREATTAQLCGRCHENVARGKKFLHHPVETGECDTCHRPHASKYPKLLDAVGTDLCLSCHREFAANMAKVKFTHKALEEGCTRCHDAHGSAYPMQVTQALPDLCRSCHETIGDHAAAPYQHPEIPDERACLACHTTHGGDLADLMSDLPVRVCMSCHKEKRPMKDVELITAMVRISDPTRFKHAPIRDGQCGGCHSIHNAEKPLLLRAAYPIQLHQRFSVDKYRLCFSCHDERLVDQEQGAGSTSFRNGRQNLHFVHVVEDGELGRNCRVCHGTHTGGYESLIRDRLPYGNWQMSIRFEKTPTGGTCVTGCHPAFRYDRENPVAARETAPPNPASPRVSAADAREPIVARWSAPDIGGTAVNVPADGRPSVLLFLRADQTQSRRVMDMVAAATPQIRLAQVVVILCGPHAEEPGRTPAATGAARWPVIADAQRALSRSLGVAVQPAVLVVGDDGVVVAHVAGAPPSLTLELEAYLDLAMRQIDRQTLHERLAEYRLVSDGPANRAVWLLQMGQDLREQGRAEEARALLTEGLKLQPDFVALRVELIRVLADLKQAQQVMSLVPQLPAGAMPSWEQNLLCGRMHAVLGEWEQARLLAAAVLREKADLGAGHYLMGMVYEHDRDWEKAAAEYRAAGSGNETLSIPGS
jgi:predicted CXXCH cytochrome family protein